jgi:D-aminoacyl-tRNA deacylase
MRIVLQRAKRAHVEVGGETVGAIADGLVIFLGITHLDSGKEAEYLADRIVHLRIFSDQEGRMNRSILETEGALLVVSQFTLYGNCKKGRRPGFDQAARPEQARELYEYFIQRLRLSNRPVETGIFQAEMEVHIVNDGPVTFILDTATNPES